MICPHWASSATTARSERTARGARRFRCRACQRPFNERTGTPFPCWPYPTAMVCLIVLGRFRYQLSLRDWGEMLLQRGLILTQEAVRKWASTWAPLRSEPLRKRRYGMGEPAGRWMQPT
jgi:putative transposase